MLGPPTNPAEYDNLAALEQQHGYYAGKRAAVQHWLEMIGTLGPEKVLLDYGAGTGWFAKELEPWCRGLVPDHHEAACGTCLGGLRRTRCSDWSTARCRRLPARSTR